jgi:hypothetical protein
MPKILMSADEMSRLKSHPRHDPRSHREILVDGLSVVNLTLPGLIRAFSASTRTTSEIVQAALGLSPAQVTRSHETRAGAALRSVGLRKSRILGPDGRRRWVWYAPPGWADPAAPRAAAASVEPAPPPDAPPLTDEQRARATSPEAMKWKPGRK